jgi:hypothetical protein
MRTVLAVVLLALPALAQRKVPKPPPPRGPERIELPATSVTGQRHAYGAVELFERKDLKVRSMVKTPESFRDEIAF